jgi:hypothetical protein
LGDVRRAWMKSRVCSKGVGSAGAQEVDIKAKYGSKRQPATEISSLNFFF